VTFQRNLISQSFARFIAGLGWNYGGCNGLYGSTPLCQYSRVDSKTAMTFFCVASRSGISLFTIFVVLFISTLSQRSPPPSPPWRIPAPARGSWLRPARKRTRAGEEVLSAGWFS
jgi:hypothetical protein